MTFDPVSPVLGLIIIHTRVRITLCTVTLQTLTLCFLPVDWFQYIYFPGVVYGVLRATVHVCANTAEVITYHMMVLTPELSPELY